MGQTSHTKIYILLVASISFLLSLTLSFSFLIFRVFSIDWPLSWMKFSALDNVFLFSYTTFFIFLSLSLYLTILFICAQLFQKTFARFLKLNKKSQICSFLFLITVPIYFAIVTAPRLSIPFLKSLLNPLLIMSNLKENQYIKPLLNDQFLNKFQKIFFYFLLMTMVGFIYRWIFKTKEIKQLFVSALSFFIASVGSFHLFLKLHYKFVYPLTSEKVFLEVVILIFSCSIALVSYYFLYRLSLFFYKKIILFKNSDKLNVFIKVFIALIILPMGISIYGLFWENIKSTMDYNKNFSQIKKSYTKKDINVILIIIDALRADHLGCYGYKKQTSPHLDNFAKEGLLFGNCYAQASSTKPSVASILSSLYPKVHGVSNDGRKALPYEVTTITEILQAHGYITYAYVNNTNLKTIFNYNQGFDFFDDYLMRDKLYYVVLRQLRKILIFLQINIRKRFDYLDRNNATLANKRIIPWLEKNKYNSFFMFIHYVEPHSPYCPPLQHRTKFLNKNNEISLYDGEICFIDENINQLFEKLKYLGIYDKTLIIITADHGEAFGEHKNYGHGETIYQEEIRVPLIVKYTECIPKGVAIKTPVKSIDIMPTVLNILNVHYNGDLDGKSLMPLIKNADGTFSNESIFIDENTSVQKAILKGVIKNINNNEWKYIFTEKSKLRDLKNVGQEELYNLTEDPHELNNLTKEKTEILKIMRNELDFYKRHCGKKALSPLEKDLDYETIQQLKSLGYIQ